MLTFYSIILIDKPVQNPATLIKNAWWGCTSLQGFLVTLASFLILLLFPYLEHCIWLNCYVCELDNSYSFLLKIY